ncbi:MAG: DUF1616 domain-containing protein [Promethearchaeota archaeon]
MDLKHKRTFKSETIDKFILETLKKSKPKPKTVKELATLVNKEHGVPIKKVLDRIEELEIEGKINLKQPEGKGAASVPDNILDYITSFNELYTIEFWVVIGLVVVTIPAAIFIPADHPLVAIRWVLGIIFVLFLSGYALTSALFPTGDEIDGIEKIALSFGLSLAVAVFDGLALNFLWEIRLVPLLVTLSIFTLVMWFLYLFRKLGKFPI